MKSDGERADERSRGSISIRRLLRWVLQDIIGREEIRRDDEREEVVAHLIDTFAEPASPDGYAGSPIIKEMVKACRRMEEAGTQSRLAEILADEAGRFDLHDLERMYAGFVDKTRNLPENYRDLLLPKIKEQIFTAHHRLLLLARSGDGDELAGTLSPDSSAYFRMVASAVIEKARTKDPSFLYLKYLLAGFTIFILGEPAHPVGTPFPGGQIVDKWEGIYLCPARDYAEGVRFALCPFCPAVQATEPTYPEMRRERKRRRKHESLNNYWTNYKG